jgi:molecular chaperone HscC
VTIVGIDLGTTNSLIGIFRDGAARLIPNVLGSTLTPSVVGVDHDGRILVGQAAKERLITHPDRTVASFKRFMGTERVTRLGGQGFRPEELSSFVLRALKADAEAYLGETVVEAVVSVPAYFNDAQRKATRRAAELANLRVERLTNEPTAAAIAYGLHEAPNESTFLVFDLGGGTFDVSVLELFDGVMEVHASAGDNQLGGEDFTKLLSDAFLQRTGVNEESLGRVMRSVLRKQAEIAKRELSTRTSTTMTLSFEGRALEWTVNRDDLEALGKELIERMRRPVERAMRDARMNVAGLHAVVLVGGATRMPLVHALAAKLFGRFPLTHIHPDEAVALGASIQAGLKARDRALSETVLTDVCPYSLGVNSAVLDENQQVIGHEFSPILERNTVVPASREQTYFPLYEDQREVRFDIYQGESRRVENNVRIGSMTLPLPPGNARSRAIHVRFTYDVNGLLEIDTAVVGGARKTLVIEGSPGSMTPEQIAARLKELEAMKIHPRDTLENRTALARAERLFEESLGDLRQRVSRLLSSFEAVLARQDAREIAKARKELLGELDRIEGARGSW